jgi:large subunit ribosomal protein L25
MALAIDSPGLQKVLNVAGGSTVIDVLVDGAEPVKALIREVQRNPVKPVDVLHVDLYEVQADETVTVDVPVHLVGTADGVKNGGGVLDQALRELEVECLPGDIPSSIDVDVTALTIGHSIFVRDVTLANGTILNDPDIPVCTVVPPRVEEEPVEVEEETTAEPELIRKAKDEDEDTEEED